MVRVELRDVGEIYEFGLAPTQLARRFGWAVLGLGLIRGKGLVSLPLALWVLGPSLYGRYSVTLAAASAIAPLALLNIPDGAGRLVVSAPSPETASSRLARIRRASLIAAAALVAGGASLGAALGSSVVFWAGVLAAATVAFKGGSVHLEYFQRTARLVRFQIVGEYLSVALGLALAAWLGLNGMLFGIAVVSGAVALAVWRSVSVRAPADREPFWVPALRLSLPLLPVAFAQWALYSLDSLLIYRLLGPAPAGAYSAAYSIAAVALLLPFGLNAVWSSTAQRLLQTSPADLVRYTRFIAGILAAAGFVLVGGAAAAAPLLRSALEDQSYADVPACVPWIAAGFIALAYAKLFEGVLYAHARPRAIFFAYVVGAVVNLALNLVWIRSFGIIGAAYATTVGYVATAAALAVMALADAARGGKRR